MHLFEDPNLLTQAFEGELGRAKLVKGSTKIAASAATPVNRIETKALQAGNLALLSGASARSHAGANRRLAREPEHLPVQGADRHPNQLPGGNPPPQPLPPPSGGRAGHTAEAGRRGAGPKVSGAAT